VTAIHWSCILSPHYCSYWCCCKVWSLKVYTASVKAVEDKYCIIMNNLSDFVW